MFFFFKQKTAYEMRISDWSSDVCSSDLTLSKPDLSSPVEAVVIELSEMRKIGMSVPDGAEAYARANAAEIKEFRISMKVSEIADHVISMMNKIGRASCRERVCQYV